MTISSATIIETFEKSKRIHSLNEDMLGITSPFLVVLDGVTGKDNSTYRNLTGGRFAAETILNTIGFLPPNIDAHSAISAINNALRDAIISETGAMPPHPPGAQLAVYSSTRKEIWRVGDIHLRIEDHCPPTPIPPTDAIAVDFRAALLEALLLSGTSVEALLKEDPSWTSLLPLLSRQDVFANLQEDHPLAYGVINGTTIPERFIQIFPVLSGQEVVFASDGYLSAKGTLEEAEKELANILQHDPLLIRLYKGFRPTAEDGSFDDRAWLRFVV